MATKAYNYTPEQLVSDTANIVKNHQGAVKMTVILEFANGAPTDISSTEGESETLRILDNAMEAIDGHRLPPETRGPDFRVAGDSPSSSSDG